jgi:PhoPQ-activated pathogenicity-related protein
MLGTILFYFAIGGLLFIMPNFIHPIISIIIKGSICSLAMYLFLKWTKISPDMNQLINQILVQIKLDKWLKI